MIPVPSPLGKEDLLMRRNELNLAGFTDFCDFVCGFSNPVCAEVVKVFPVRSVGPVALLMTLVTGVCPPKVMKQCRSELELRTAKECHPRAKVVHPKVIYPNDAIMFLRLEKRLRVELGATVTGLFAPERPPHRYQ